MNTWTKEEKTKLKQYVESLNEAEPNYQECAQLIGTRSAAECQNAIEAAKTMLPHHKWTAQEIETLMTYDTAKITWKQFQETFFSSLEVSQLKSQYNRQRTLRKTEDQESTQTQRTKRPDEQNMSMVSNTSREFGKLQNSSRQFAQSPIISSIPLATQQINNQFASLQVPKTMMDIRVPDMLGPIPILYKAENEQNAIQNPRVSLTQIANSSKIFAEPDPFTNNSYQLEKKPLFKTIRQKELSSPEQRCEIKTQISKQKNDEDDKKGYYGRDERPDFISFDFK